MARAMDATLPARTSILEHPEARALLGELDMPALAAEVEQHRRAQTASRGLRKEELPLDILAQAKSGGDPRFPRG